MHTLLFRSVAFAALLAAGRALAAETAPVIASAKANGGLDGATFHGIGTPRGALLLALGAPSEALTEDVWIYRDFRSAHGAARPNYDTLIVTFAADRVVAMRLVDGRALAALLKQKRKEIFAQVETQPRR